MKKILVVEDSKLIANAIKIILKPEGISVEHTAQGEMANDIIKKKKIDLVILDLMMPGMNGYDVFNRLKQDDEIKKVPIIILSAKTDALKWNDTIRSCDKFIPKPYENAELISEVKKLLKV